MTPKQSLWMLMEQNPHRTLQQKAKPSGKQLSDIFMYPKVCHSISNLCSSPYNFFERAQVRTNKKTQKQYTNRHLA